MKPNLKQDLPLLPFILLPVAYLIFIWNDLPQQVPMHWNIDGEIDRYGDKSTLAILAIGLPLISYLLILFIPMIDPKKRIAQMGKKLQHIKYVLTLFMVGIALFIVYASANQSTHNFNFLILGLGLFFVFLGSYFKTIKPNYFLGIRTPWTLESETVWKSTHILAGKMWFIGGLIIVLISMLVPHKYSLIIFLVITGIITIIPIAYSYVLYKREKAS